MRNILISGASGIVGYGILRSLKNSGRDFNLIGTTIYEDSVAQAFCDVFEKAVPTSNEHYIDWLLSTIYKHNIDLIIPGIEADMYKWLDHQQEIEKSGTNILLNNKELIMLCRDKWVFYESLKRSGMQYAIESSLENDIDVLVNKFGLPFLLKPRSGFASKGIVYVSNKDILNLHKEKIGKELMAQPIVGNVNEEYTTSAFCDGKGGFGPYMTLKRKLSKEGFTEKAEVEQPDGIHLALSGLCHHFMPLGPTNFQFRVHEGGLKLLEINPRISSSTSIRTAFGYNESVMAVDYFLDNKWPKQPEIKKGKAIRYTEDFISYK